MSLSEDEVSRRYPIHWLVWNNRHEELKEALEAQKFTAEELEVHDPRGRTPLLLAVTLGYTEAARALIDAGADVNCEKDGWTAVQEATVTGDRELLSLVLSRRDFQRYALRSGGIPELLQRLSLAPDFYVEMKWEFTSWVPLVSRMCPFDTYKVYKRGANVRVDTTLVGFENNKWQRGDRTYIFRGQGNTASLVELDHEAGTSWCEYLEAASSSRAWPPPHKRALEQRMSAPLAINYLDTDKICFERNKCGIWGWRQDKTEVVNGYECKVYSANNVELVSKTRSEHLPRGSRKSSPRAPLAGLLALAEPDRELEESEDSSPTTASASNEELPPPAPVSWQEYFSEAPIDRDVGRPKDVQTKVQKFKATLWLCEDYPLELQEQIMPILDLMASISSPHFAKLKDFIQMQLPSGFPVKIEIPLFHVINARITFGNIFAMETPVAHVECIPEGDRLACVVDDACFSVGRQYRDAAAPDESQCKRKQHYPRMETPACVLDDACFSVGRQYRDAAAPDERICVDDEESLLQYAIQQSLMEAGTHEDQVDVWEALRGTRPVTPVPGAGGAAPDTPKFTAADLLAHEERQLQRAIEASLSGSCVAPPSPASDYSDCEGDLREALELSAKEQQELADQLAREQQLLDEALRLSLTDK